MTEPSDRRPGDIILDRYLPDASPEEREIARAQLIDLVDWHMRLIMRQMREDADSRAEHGHGKLDST